uniref:SAM domain-containing protein n=1 Tax=Arundo donax TaxID=35708 RepID=A0A0A9CHD0_ARUDO
MYSDRSSGRKRSVRDRLGSDGIGGGDSRSRSDDAKRFRRNDGTWRRELYKDSGGIQSSSGLASRNLQSNQNSHLQQSIEVVKKSSVTDLREKLSGVQHPQLNSTVQIPKPVKEIVKSDKSVQKRDPPPTATPPVTMKVSAPAPSAPKQSAPAPSAPKQSQEKADALLDSLLKSLDLEKYLINFQAEEVDMKALVHMNEDDMKSLGIPMGPRKKILSALAHKNRKSSKSLPTS